LMVCDRRERARAMRPNLDLTFTSHPNPTQNRFTIAAYRMELYRLLHVDATVGYPVLEQMLNERLDCIIADGEEGQEGEAAAQ